MIGNLDRRIWSAQGWMNDHRSVRALGIGQSDLVLDVGSGQNPHPRANVLCDLFVSDNTERASEGALRVDRPLVVSDATRMPFPDRAFDFVYCLQLLEHMEDPAALLDELQRVAKAGYIETPARVYEKLYGWRFHRWFVSAENGRLRLEAKKRPIFDEDLHRWYEREMSQPAFWRTFIPRLRDRGLLTAHVWRGEIEYEIVGEVDPTAPGFAAAESADSLDDGPPEAETPAQRFKSRVDSRWRRQGDLRVGDVLGHLRCPACEAEMQLGDGLAECGECGERVRILGLG
jgi:SAM-dependent methyltransferase